MTEQEFEEMMQEITNDPWYIAHQEELKQEMMQALDHLTDEEIAELCQ
jgi:Txe/YoeB family toxin of Txe-Axe toxin-antitoxin module